MPTWQMLLTREQAVSTSMTTKSGAYERSPSGIEATSNRFGSVITRFSMPPLYTTEHGAQALNVIENSSPTRHRAAV
ncbi:hypothetical protein BH09PSE3_BH09PSE3_12400 [soil metagenome]